jgi:hypothetical protein
MPKTSVALVLAEGNFYKEQFDKSTDDELEDLIEQRIDEAAAEIEKSVGPDFYSSSEPSTVQVITTAETYLAVSKCWQTLHNILIAWDKEQLPSEHISEKESAANRDYYRAKAQQTLALLNLLPPFRTAGIQEA